VIAFFEVISTSAPHIYHSALPLSPQTSIIHKLYKPYAHPLARVVRGLPVSWEPIVTTIRYPEHVGRITWSPCNRYIGVSLDDLARIVVLDAVTLKQLHTFESQGYGQWLSFSPDSHSLTQFNEDHNGHITWDLQTGGQISIIHSISPITHSECFSSTYSNDGNMVAVAYNHLFNQIPTGISIYNLLSKTCTYSHQVTEGQVVTPIWTHGEFLRFVTVKPGSITIWEVRFTSMHTLAKVELLSAPDDIGDLEKALFLPHLSRLAYICKGGTLAVWDAQDSKLLLSFPSREWFSGMSFSSDGHFFVCGSYDQQAYLFKETSTGYVLCQTVTCGANRLTGSGILGRSIQPIFSPNAESITISNDQDIQLWHTADPITSLSNIQVQPAVKTHFLLQFSPDGSIVAIARWGDHIVTVLNLKSGNSQLVIDTGVGVCGLRATGNAIVVVVLGKIITWNLPTGDHVLDARVTINNSVQTVTFNHPPPLFSQSAAISPDFNYIAIFQGEFEDGLDIYDMSTGDHLADTTTKSDQGLWITPNGCEVSGL